MAKCECGSDKFIKLEGYHLSLYPDDEPYEKGVEEELTQEDEKLLNDLELYINMNVCKKCKKVFFYINDDEYVKVNNMKDNGKCKS